MQHTKLQAKAIVLLLCCLFYGLAARAQMDFLGKDYAKVPFERYGTLMVLKVSLNNSDTLRFILDTGLRTTLVGSLTAKDSLTLNAARKITLYGLGRGESLDAYVSLKNKLNFYSLGVDNFTVLLPVSRSIDFSGKLGVHIHGIIGADLFRNAIVYIDSRNREIIFLRPGSKIAKRYSKRFATTLPLEHKVGKAYIRAEIEDDTQTYPISLLIDTGNAHALWVYPSETISLSSSSVLDSLYLGEGLSGAISGQIKRMKSLRFEGLAPLEQVTVSFPDTSSTRYRENFTALDGGLGGEVFRRCDVLLDFVNQKVGFRPHSLWKKPFYFTLSGLEVNQPLPKLPLFMVEYVFPGSVAEKAGLKEGEQLLNINGKATSRMNLNEVIALLKKREGKKMRLEVLTSEGETKKVKFKLAPLLPLLD